jgi:NAD(P)-dependent dehydrogenase (short-subunit alcohol dehydrogenase family)
LFPETALVTGGASGIGAAIVERLEADGAKVRVLDLAADGFDVADSSAWEAVEPVQLACLNAGVLTGNEDLRELSDAAFRRVVGTNVDGVVFGLRRMARVMEQGSAIVVTASLAGLTTMYTDPIYAATKSFVVGLVRSAAFQLTERGITVNAVCPAVVDTPMVGDLRDRIQGAGIDLLTAAEIADAVVAAARDGSTGQAWTCLPGRPPEKHEFPRFFESA